MANFFLEDDHEDDYDDEEFDKDDFDSDEEDEKDKEKDHEDDDDNEDDEDPGFNTYVETDEDDSEEEESSSDEAVGLYNKLAKCAYASTVVKNNIHHIHLHACGRKFNNIHKMAYELMEIVEDKIDTYAELALQDDTTELDNMSNAANHCPEFDIETKSCYKYEDAYKSMKENLCKLIDVLKDARSASEERSDIQSTIDSYLEQLNKYARYILKRSLDSCEACDESYNTFI